MKKALAIAMAVAMALVIGFAIGYAVGKADSRPAAWVDSTGEIYTEK